MLILLFWKTLTHSPVKLTLKIEKALSTPSFEGIILKLLLKSYDKKPEDKFVKQDPEVGMSI
jgi:hypothetical protein